MNEQATAVANTLANTLTLASIHPSKGSKYSPNLYEYLKKNKVQTEYARVFRDASETLWIGYLFDGDLIGARLNQVLCYGKKTDTFSYPLPEGLVELENFWSQYQEVGRCAIDVDHVTAFLGDGARWKGNDSHRSCLWCGQVTQQLETYTEVVTHQRWVSLAKP